MAKKSKSTKKSRFGNPAKASADAAARAHVISLADVRLDKAMEALAPGFALWLENRGDTAPNVDVSLMILDDFFDMYRILEPGTDARSLLPDAVSEVLDAAAAANPQATFALRSGVRDYVDYLTAASLWTGTAEDLVTVRGSLTQHALPGLAADMDLNLGALLPEDGGETEFEDYLDPSEFDFPDVYVPEMSPEDVLATMAGTPLWQNTLALMDWIGDGRRVTAKGILGKKERLEAAAELVHSGLGSLAGALQLTTSKEHALSRLAVYWELLQASHFLEFTPTHVQLNRERLEPLSEQELMITLLPDLLQHLIFLSTLDGSEPGRFEDWHLDMAHMLTLCASATPPASTVVVNAVAQPVIENPDLLLMVQKVAHWAEEGLVTVGTHIEVPPAFRILVAEMFSEDFNVTMVSPGAATDMFKVLEQL